MTKTIAAAAALVTLILVAARLGGGYLLFHEGDQAPSAQVVCNEVLVASGTKTDSNPFGGLPEPTYSKVKRCKLMTP